MMYLQLKLLFLCITLHIKHNQLVLCFVFALFADFQYQVKYPMFENYTISFIDDILLSRLFLPLLNWDCFCNIYII